MNGECLCGSVRFRIQGSLPNLYQCHCSLCRKATGAAANAATLVPLEQFTWLAGEALIRSYQKPSGFRSDFCGQCGSPVPNTLRDTPLVWVPAGLLDENANTARVAVHLHQASAAPWELPLPQCSALSGGPDSLAQLQQLLQSRDHPG
ncbi:GFA family protein [Marinobacter sp. C2H3]|uniref:GFA family protein n=1 Tax=Marinobacter sp. C2H3 TaxID=3119003 RepID=UPI00300F10F3